ncbi:MAG: hypothetical protein C4B59_14420 [Candidatus Methanogaster sp.]|uniref:Uncharacterized protein n=1 Tax=Candidatus Methanogaster sp. TaxID=3386292 RepID=A0AC61KZ41_9EURY|nr:MAG: hypothetical protein C4B59_14420 [ANME-2 cluster archaeon]
MKKTTSSLIVLVAIVSVAIFAGCVEEKISAAEDVNRAVSLMETGNTRIEKINWESGAYSDAKAKLAASEVDYEEALKILDNATTDYDDEKDAIGTAKVMCSYSLDGIAAFQNLTICLEHLDKVSAYMEGDDVASMRSELELAEDALNDTLPFASAAKEKCFSIDADTIPVESRSGLLEDRISIEQSEKIILEFGVLMSGMHPFIDGMEHMLKATEYVEKEEWHSAELELDKCSADFSESKDILADLKNSEFAEISVPAIAIHGILTKMLEALPHLEAGCRYADRGNFKKADEEFNKIPVF